MRGDNRRCAVGALAMLVALGMVALAPPSAAQTQVVGVELALMIAEDLGEVGEEPLLVEGQLVVKVDAAAPERLDIVLDQMSDIGWSATVEPAEVQIDWQPGMPTEQVIPFVLNVSVNPLFTEYGEVGQVVVAATAVGGAFYEYAETVRHLNATMGWIPGLREGFGIEDLTVVENEPPVRERVSVSNDGNGDVLLTLEFEATPPGCAIQLVDAAPVFAYAHASFIDLPFDVACGLNATGGEARYVVHQRLADDPTRKGPEFRGSFRVRVLVEIESECSGILTRSCGTTYGSREEAEAYRAAKEAARTAEAAAEAAEAAKAAQLAPAATEPEEPPRETPAPAFVGLVALAAAARLARRR